MFAGVLEDVAADILDCEVGIDEEIFELGDGAGAAASFSDDPELFNEAPNEENFEAEVEEEEEEALDVADTGVDEPAPPPWERATISPMGYISVDVPPWSSAGNIGRLTSWPASAALEARSVSMKCYMHSSCSSPARKRHAVADSVFLKWLFSMEPMQNATVVERRAGATQHKAKWATILADSAPPAPAAGAAAAASSSSRGV